MFPWLSLAVLLGAVGTSSCYRYRARLSNETISREQEGVTLLAIRLGLALLLVFPIIGYVAVPQSMTWASLALPSWCRWLGVVAGVSTIPVIAWVLRTLGRNVSETVLTKGNHHLVTTGPYRWVRHPLYATGIALFLALSLTDASWLVLLVTVLVVAFLQLLVIPLEEQALMEKFGEDYRAYLRNTGRFLPRMLSAPRSVHALILIALLVSFQRQLGHASDAPHQTDTEELGAVHFPISCLHGLQKSFERGVALLHSFWYEEARKEFESVARQDPRCDIAYWGIAMSYWSQVAGDWPSDDDVELARQALAKPRNSSCPRERDYIQAIKDFYEAPGQIDFPARAQAYSSAMKRICEKYPDDQEAAAFYGLSLLASEPDGDTSFSNRKQAAVVLEKLFSQAPNDGWGDSHRALELTL